VGGRTFEGGVLAGHYGIYSQQLSTYIHEATMCHVIDFVAQKKKLSV